MSQTIILDRSTSGRVRAKNTTHLIVIITNLLLKKIAQKTAQAELPKRQQRTIHMSEPYASSINHPHIDRFLQRIDR